MYAHRYYQSGSFNVQPYHECVERWGDGSRKHYSRWNNEAQCTANGGQWLALSNYLERAPREFDASSLIVVLDLAYMVDVSLLCTFVLSLKFLLLYILCDQLTCVYRAQQRAGLCGCEQCRHALHLGGAARLTVAEPSMLRRSRRA